MAKTATRRRGGRHRVGCCCPTCGPLGTQTIHPADQGATARMLVSLWSLEDVAEEITLGGHNCLQHPIDGSAARPCLGCSVEYDAQLLSLLLRRCYLATNKRELPIFGHAAEAYRRLQTTVAVLLGPSDAAASAR